MQRRKMIAAVVLAAGRSTRMGGTNKLLATIGSRSMVRIAAQEALAARVSRVVVVTGFQRDDVEKALAGLDLALVHNPDYAAGLSTSLKAGLSALPPDIEGAVILLADMPHVSAALIDLLIEAFDPASAPVVVPSFEGKRGNPVLWARRYFTDLMSVRGDIGGREILQGLGDAAKEIPAEDRAALIDVDTPEALARVRADDRL